MSGQNTTTERIIERIATRSHGIVSRAELRAANVSEAKIDHRLAIGSLIREFPGVYRVGHRAPSIQATYMAAVKACGSEAALSGLAAAHLLGLVSRAPYMPEVTAPGKKRIPGIKTRRSNRLEATTHKGIRVTTPPRTLVDIAAYLPEDELALACHKAGVRYSTTPRQVGAVLKRRPNAPGAAKLRRVVSGDTKATLSALEREFLQRLEEASLPLPDRVNKRAGSKRVDCRWTSRRLTVELDSYRFHNSRHAWEQDRKREREAYARGDQFRRYTWGDVFEHPSQMITELRGLLGTPGR